MKWHYESDGDAHCKTHYIYKTNLEGRSLKETFLRIDCRSKQQAIRLCLNLNILGIAGIDTNELIGGIQFQIDCNS